MIEQKTHLREGPAIWPTVAQCDVMSNVEPVPADFGLFKGLLFGLPLSALLWWAIFAVVRAL